MYPQITSTQSHHCQTGGTKVHPSVKKIQTGVIILCCHKYFSGKILVATQNIDTSRPIWTFSLRGIPTFGTTSLDIN